MAAYVGMSTPVRNPSGRGQAQDCMGPVSNSDTLCQQEAVTVMAQIDSSYLHEDRSFLDRVNPKGVLIKGGRHTLQIPADNTGEESSY